MDKPQILIVEDESLIAAEIEEILVENGYAIAGVFTEVMRTEEFLRNNAKVDAALIDIVVRDQHAYGLCKTLDKRGIPFGFVTGLLHCEIRKRWRDRPCVEKPFLVSDIPELLLALTTTKSAAIKPGSNRSITWA